MHVVAVDKKIIVYMAAKSFVLSTEDRQVVGQGCLPLSSTRSLPCLQRLALLALFTATGKHNYMAHIFTYPCSQQQVSIYGPYFHLSGTIRHGFPTTLAKGVRIIEGTLYFHV